MHTPASVERELRLLVKSDAVKFFIGKLPDASGMLVFSRPKVIVLDPFNGGLIETTVHELMHWRFLRKMKGFGKTLEEAQIVALEDQVVRFINRSKRRVTWWRNAITKRLP